jgi:hypothetical protein
MPDDRKPRQIGVLFGQIAAGACTPTGRDYERSKGHDLVSIAGKLVHNFII